ncbi:ATP-binding protein [Chlamydiales bacterium]|nr:ATP-binding protein [Chlamydiales bacterium]
MFLKRHIHKYLNGYLKKYPIITITGPRQSGKTTLAKKTCENYKYVSLEDPDNLEYATEDPRGFLDANSENVIFDEVQQAPKLFSYLQGEVDKNPKPGRFILTGSQQFLLNQKISQTLAGRTARLTLLPLSLSELCQHDHQKLWLTGSLTQPPPPPESLYFYLLSGLYPRLYEYNLKPQQFFRDYINTYVTRDLQQLLHVGDLRLFQNFLRMLAGRCGQRVNLTSLGNDLGVTHTTIKRWLSVLEASYIITLLEPYHNNFNKRLIKSPKIYFLDTGLLCYLLRIKKTEDLRFHSQIGGIFETFVISEMMKSFYHHDQEPPLYFWQERTGEEIDIMVDQGQSLLLPIEVKSSQTISQKLFENLHYWLNIKDNPQDKGYLIYGGKEWQKRKNIQVIPWYGLS